MTPGSFSPNFKRNVRKYAFLETHIGQCIIVHAEHAMWTAVQDKMLNYLCKSRTQFFRLCECMYKTERIRIYHKVMKIALLQP